jgi:hypothetical protein
MAADAAGASATTEAPLEGRIITEARERIFLIPIDRQRSVTALVHLR